jgi:hypothetical protein
MTKSDGMTIPMHVYSREDIICEKIDDAESYMHPSPNDGRSNNILLHKQSHYNMKKNMRNNMNNTTDTIFTESNRTDALNHYITNKKNQQLKLLHSQSYDTDQCFGVILTSTKKWTTGEETDIF